MISGSRFLRKAGVVLAVVASQLGGRGAEISGAGAKRHQLLPAARMALPEVAEASPEAAPNLKRISVR